MSKGLSNKMIAIELGIGYQTTKNYVSSILGKMEAGNRAHAVALAKESEVNVKVNMSIKSLDLDKEDLRALLQAIRDCEMSTFPEKKIYVSVEAPDMSSADMTDVLKSIKPPYDYGPVIYKYKGKEKACPTCGKPNPLDVSRCIHCGATLR